ncbi:unnamed protein product [Rhizoctonia solani]|uniref:BTB domain-containing protein n=1 Tax=Rhizoctonia solani TaxID=456999 RepID=A0A8H3AT65_9AGAM|nr:unnamed protein product [Rhizoctonia solani]
MLFLNPSPGLAKKFSIVLPSQSGSAVFVGDDSKVEHDDGPAEIPIGKSPEVIVRHSEFFFGNTLIAIQVENTLFNVHEYQLAKSEFFSEIFKLPRPKGNKPQEGTSPEHPIVIHGTTASDFAALLKVLYASHFSINHPTPEASLIIPAFRLASLLNFSELRAYLLPLAEKNLDDVDKLVFAREFRIKDWLAPALIRLCEGEAVLSTEEARKLDIDSVLLLWRIQEHHWPRISGRTYASTGNSVYCQSCTDWEYYGHMNATCQLCSVKVNTHFLSYKGRDRTNGDIDDAALKTEVKQWVEDRFIIRA